MYTWLSFRNIFQLLCAVSVIQGKILKWLKDCLMKCLAIAGKILTVQVLAISSISYKCVFCFLASQLLRFETQLGKRVSWS